MSASDRFTSSSRSGAPLSNDSDRPHRRHRRSSERSDVSARGVSMRELKSELINKSQLNEQLQADYDETLQRLAEAELTIDQLRFGVQTQVSKTVYYTLKENPDERDSRESARESSRRHVPMATREVANQTTGMERSLSSEEDVTTMSTATRGQRANVESTQMGLLFQTRTLQDRLDQIQEAVKARVAMSGDVVAELERIGDEVKKIEQQMENVWESQDKLYQMRGVQSEANYDHLGEELNHLKVMLAETQEAIQQPQSQTPEEEAMHEATQHTEILSPQHPTLQDVIDRLAGLEEQQRLNPTPGVAAEIRQLRQAVEQLHGEVSCRREATQTATPDVAHCDGSVSSHPSCDQRTPPTETSVQTQPMLSQEYLSRSDGFLVTNETQTDKQRSFPMISRLRQPQVYRRVAKMPDMHGRVSRSSISVSPSEQSDNTTHSQTRVRGNRAHNQSQSSGDEHHRRQSFNRHTHTSDTPSDHYEAQIPPLIPHASSHPRNTQTHAKSQTQTEQQTIGVQASPYIPQPSRIPRPLSYWKKPGNRVGLGDSFDRDSGFVGSSVQPKDERQQAISPIMTHSSVSVLPENGEEESNLINEMETVQPVVTRYEYVQQPPVFVPPRFPAQFAGLYPGVGDRDGGGQHRDVQPVVQPDPSMSSAVDGLRDELQRLRKQMETLKATQDVPTEETDEHQTNPTTTTTKATAAIQTDEPPDRTDRPTEHHPRPHLPTEPTHLLHHPQLNSLSSDVEQPRRHTSAPRRYTPFEDRHKTHKRLKPTEEDGRQRRRHQERSHESETHDSESDLPRLLNSHRTQTPSMWRLKDMENTPRRGMLANTPSLLRMSLSSVSCSDSDSNAGSIVVDTNTDEFECPMCGGTGTFVTPLGERRHHHEKKKKSRGMQTVESYLENTHTGGHERRELSRQRKSRRFNTSHTLPLYVDVRRDLSPIQRDRSRRNRTQPVVVREAAPQKHTRKFDGDEHEDEGGNPKGSHVARSLSNEFRRDESETDSSSTPHVILKQKPQAESTPYVYHSDESSSSDGSHIVVTEKQRKRNPHVIILDETEEPDRVVIHKRPARRNSVHVVREASPSRTHIVRERLPSRTHIMRERPVATSTTHIVEERSPHTTHIVRDRRPSTTRITRERPTSHTHIVRDREPSVTHIVREKESPITHIVRDREPLDTYVVRERQPSSMHIVRERPPTTTHIVKERPATSHLVLEDDDDDDCDVEVFVGRNRARRASPVRRRSRYALSNASDVVETDDIEMALRRVKRETRRASHRSRDIFHNMSTELNSKGVL